MTSFLRQATASQAVAIGPFLDDTDFKTAETGLTINASDIKLVINGAASANKNSGGGTHRVNGVYGITLDATDTATIGEIELSVVVSGALPVFHKFQVLAPAAYDQLCNTTGALSLSGIVDSGTAQSATSTTLVLRSAAAFADSELVGATVVIRSASAGAGQRRLITANVGSTDTITVDTWTTTPTGTIVYDIYGSPPASASAPPTANVTQWLGTAVATPGTAGVPSVDAIRIGTTVQTTGVDLVARVGAPAGASVSADIAAVKTQTGAIETDTQDIQSRVPAALVSGRIDASVGAMAANVVTASALASDAGAEIADAVWDEATSGHTTAGSTGKALTDASSAGDPWSTALPGSYTAGTAGKVIGDLSGTKTVVDAVKAKTDNLPSDPADASDIASSFSTVNSKLDAIDDFVDTEVAAIKAKTDNLPSDPADASDIAASLSTITGYIDTEVASILAAVDTEVGAIKAVTDALPNAGALSDLGTLTSRLTSARAGYLDNLNGNVAQTGDVYAALTGAQAEPGRATPAANASPLTKLAYLYKNWRNKKTQTSTAWSLFNDDASTVDQKATVGDDGSTTTKGEIATGP